MAAHYYRACPAKTTRWISPQFEAYCDECSDDERLLPEPELWSATDERGETLWHLTQWFPDGSGRPLLVDCDSEPLARLVLAQILEQRREGRNETMRRILAQTRP